MTYTLKKIGVQSFAKFYAAFLLFFSLFAAIPMGLMMMNQNGAVGLLIMAFIPFAYGAMGYIFGLLFGAIFNFVAGKVGGIDFEFEKAHK